MCRNVEFFELIGKSLEVSVTDLELALYLARLGHKIGASPPGTPGSAHPPSRVLFLVTSAPYNGPFTGVSSSSGN